MHKKNRSFPETTTKWTLIKHAADPAHPRARQAFAELYELYAYPLYCVLRAAGRTHEQAEDLVQAFFLYLEEQRQGLRKGNLLKKADPGTGSFRVFIKMNLLSFMKDEHARTLAQRRGAGKIVSFDGLAAAARYAAEPRDHRSPDTLYDHQFSLEILGLAMKDLAAEAGADGKAELFAALRPHLNDEADFEGYAALAVRLNLPLATLRSHAKRFRDRFREIYDSLVADTVDNPADIKPEKIAHGDALGSGAEPPVT